MENVIEESLLKRALVEVYEVLIRLDAEEYNKIPEEVFETIEKNKDNTYEWEYDDTKKLQFQNISEYALGILANINHDYLLNEEQKQLMQQYYIMNDQKADEEKYKNLNPLFKEQPKAEEKADTVVEEILPVATEKVSIFKRIFSKVKEILFMEI